MHGHFRLALKAILAAFALAASILLGLGLLLTDLGRGGGRDLEAGLFPEADWVLHLHRPEELRTVLASERDLLADPDWRWLLGLGATPAEDALAATRSLVNELGTGEILLAGAWAPADAPAPDRLMLVFRPASTRVPRLVQLARSRWFFERFLKSRLPALVSPAWLDGLILFGTADGGRELVLGSCLDLVVVGSRESDVRAYLEAQLAAPARREVDSWARLELSARARGQLADALTRVLGPDLLEAARPILAQTAPGVDCRPTGGQGLALTWIAAGDSNRDRADALILGRALADRQPELRPTIAENPLGPGPLLEVEAGAETAADILARLEAERLAGEAEPKGARLEALRRELNPGTAAMSEELFQAQLAATRGFREERVRREAVCWRDLLGRGFRFEVRSEDGQRRFEFSLTQPFP